MIFVGLEITAQSFHATPARHYPAVALACVPALAYLAVLSYQAAFAGAEAFRRDCSRATQHWIQTVTVIAGGGGFIITSLLWATAMVHMIDGRIRPVVATLLIAAVFSWFGVIHSPLSDSPILPPGAVIGRLRAEGRAAATWQQTPYHWAGAYVLTAVALVLLYKFGKAPGTGTESHGHSEQAAAEV